MRVEIIIFLITIGLIGNVYTDGNVLKKLLSYKKYYQMMGIAFGGLVFWWLLKKNPQKANELISSSHEYLKYLPVDQNVSSVISPILDFTSRQNYSSEIDNGTMVGGGSYSMINMLLPPKKTDDHTQRMMHSGKTGTKRSVSETKKKFVASRQNWKCGDCGDQLSAWFEVDHKTRLEYGGSNHIDNLIALCRECHGKKTTIENL